MQESHVLTLSLHKGQTVNFTIYFWGQPLGELQSLEHLLCCDITISYNLFSIWLPRPATVSEFSSQLFSLLNSAYSSVQDLHQAPPVEWSCCFPSYPCGHVLQGPMCIGISWEEVESQGMLFTHRKLGWCPCSLLFFLTGPYFSPLTCLSNTSPSRSYTFSAKPFTYYPPRI